MDASTATRDVPGAAPGKAISEAARRALEEAHARRAAEGQAPRADGAGERQGRDGLEPTRFGDWEFKGMAVDF
jgi:hypothetical protein